MRRTLILVCTLTLAATVPGTAVGAEHVTRTSDTPPTNWQEHWFDHTENLQRIDYNDTVALYFDSDVNPDAQQWLMPYLTAMWQYAQKTYGDPDNELTGNRLYSIHHEGKHYGGHPSTVYDESHDYRNVSDVGGDDWTSPQHSIVTHEAGHVVESTASGKHGSPAFGLWGDSKWMEFFIYDVYTGLGMTEEAQEVYDNWTADDHVDDFPRADTHWFRDWFHPLWRDHGHAEVMVRYFDLVGRYFPSSGEEFTRDMNWGEYIHFTSGAAGVNLKELATNAFGWPDEWEAQFVQAQADFPEITYS